MNRIMSQQYKYNIITKKDFTILLYAIFGFIISRGILFTFVSPFAITFLALFLGQSIINFCIIYLTICFGLYETFHGLFFYTYFTAITLILFVNIVLNLKPHLKEFLSTQLMGIISAICVIISSLIPIFYYNFSLYFFVAFILLAIYSFILPIIVSPGFTIFKFKGTIKPLSTEEAISLSILLSGFVLGSTHFNLEYFNVNSFFIITAIYILSYSSGSGNAVACAFSLSFISFLSGSLTSNQIIIFALSGIFCGLSKNGNKLKNIFGMVISLIVAYFYVDKTFFTTSNLVSITCATAFFYILPTNWYLILQSTFGQVVDNSNDYGDKIKYFTSSKLSNYSKSFIKLSKTFKSLAIKKEKLNQEDIANLINSVVNKTCKNCENRKHCWQSVFYTTYKLSTKLIEDIEENDKIKIGETSESFKTICKNHETFIENTNIYFEFYKSNMVWHNKISENKSLIADQLFDISNIFGNIVETLNEKITFLPKYENIISKSLENNNISPSKVLVLKNDKGVFNIWISLDIDINERNAFKTIQRLVGNAVGNNVKIIKTTLSFNGNYEIYLEEAYKYRVIFGIAKAKKNKTKISGDSYSTLNLESGETLLAISDGMGSGKKASIESVAAIDLFEDFIEAGFEKKLAIKLINSSLILKSSDDSFTTLDACIIDLHKGLAQFMKIGAVPTIILRGNETITISSQSLPIGILNDIDMDIVEKQLRDGDIIILMSDGILEVIHSIEEQNKWIRKVIKNFAGRNPQDIADNIVVESQSMAKGVVKDDMTVVVGRIVKNKN